MKNKILYIILLALNVSFMLSQTCIGDNCFEPIPDAGDDKTYFQGIEVILDGSESYDPDNADCVLLYYWTSPNGIVLVEGDNPSHTSFMAPNFDTLLEGCSNSDYGTENDCLEAGEM